MFQFQALTRSDSTLVPCLWCCLYITFSSAHPSPKAHLVYFFYVTGLCPCTRPPPTPPPPFPGPPHLFCLEHSSPRWEGVTMWLLPCLLPAAPSQYVSLCSPPKQHTRVPAVPPPRTLSLGSRCLTVRLCLACEFSAIKPFGLPTLLHLNYTRNLTIRNCPT